MKRDSAPVSPALRVILAITLFLSEGTGAFAARDLWSDRRRAVHAVRSSPPSFRSSPWEKLVASFPSVEKGVPLPLPGPTAQTPLPDWLESAVGLYADVGESHPPAKGEHRVLIHIQDLHEVEEAQRNTAAVLEQLAASLGGKKGLLVGLEGAAGGFRTADFRALASPPLIRRAANRFLKAGIISGPEFFSLTTRKPFRLWGVEDAPAYAANIRALTDTFPFQSKDDATVARALGNVEKLKEKMYPAALAELDRLRTQYEEGRIGLAAYVQKIAQGAPADSVGPTLRLFLDAVAQEDDLSLSRVAQDQTRLLETLAPRLKESEVQQLVETGLAHRMGRASFSRFYGLLKRICAKHSVSLDDYPALVAHAAYVVKAEEINPSLLLGDVETLADRSLRSLLTSPTLVELAALNDDARLIEKLNRFVLAPAEYRKLVLRRPEVKRWHTRGEVLGVGIPLGGWPDLAPVMERHENFYLQAERRNGPLVKNLLPPWGNEGPAVLVAGGYHADGVRAVALSQGLGYISLIPRISSIENLPPPLDSFRSKGKKNEWVFRGNQSGLHRPLPTALNTGDDQFLKQWISVLVAEITASVVATENSSSASFVSHLNLVLDEMAVVAGRFGLELKFDANPLKTNADQGTVVVVDFSFRDRHSNPANPETVRGSTTVLLSGKRAGDVRVRIYSAPVLASLLERLGFQDAESDVLRRISAGWEQLSVWSAQIVYALGRDAQKTAISLVSPLRHFESDWMTALVNDWVQTFHLREDRLYVNKIALVAPVGLQGPLLFRLAERRGVSIDKALEESLAQSVPREESVAFSMSPDRKTLTMRVNRAGADPIEIDLGLNNSRALAEARSPYQLFQTSQGRFRVSLPEPSVSRTDITPIVIRGILREIRALAEGKDAVEARALALSPLDQWTLQWHYRVTQIQASMEAVDGKMAVEEGGPIQLKTGPETDRQIRDSLNNAGSLVDVFSGDPITNQMDLNISLLSTFLMKPASRSTGSFARDIRGMELFAASAEEGRGSDRTLASELLWNRLVAVGEAEGAAHSKRKGVLEDALSESVQEKFLPLAQSLLGYLSVSGVPLDRVTPNDATGFVNQMLRLYVAHFKEGFQQGREARTADLAHLSGGVFHLKGPVETSPVANQLLDVLMGQSNPDNFRAMVLIDSSEEDSEGIVEGLAKLLEKRPDSPGRLGALQVLRSDHLVVRKADAFRVNGAISLERVLREFQDLWRTLNDVGVFTSDSNAFVQDVESVALSWALIVDGKIVSQSVEDAAFKQAIQAFVRQQA